MDEEFRQRDLLGGCTLESRRGLYFGRFVEHKRGDRYRWFSDSHLGGDGQPGG